MSSYLERLKRQWKKEAVAKGHAESEAYRKSLLQEFQLI